MAEATVHVLVACTGNICRSPMAEVLLRDYADRRGRKIEVRSGSVLGIAGHPAHKNAVKVMEEVGLDLHKHRSQPVTEEMISWADYILVMEFQHSTRLRERFPQADSKIMMMGTFGGLMEIKDPLGWWKGPFVKCREELLTCIEAFVDNLPDDPR